MQGRRRHQVREQLTEKPGGLLLHPLFFISTGVLVVNDEWLKTSQVLPNLFTGKLSDAAGLIAFPVALTAVAEVIRRSVCSSRTQILVSLVVALGFTLVKVSPVFAQFIGHAMAVMSTPIRLLKGQGAADSIHYVGDRSDLLMLPFCCVGIPLAARRGRK